MLAISNYQQARTTHEHLKEDLQKICAAFNKIEDAQNMLDQAEQGISSKNVANIFDNQIIPAMTEYDKTTEAFLAELDSLIKETEGTLETDTESEKTAVINKYTDMIN